MNSYEKPMILANEGLAEGIYLASGASDSSDGSGIGCDSKYMNGVFQAPDYSQWAAGENRDYRTQFGCLGCPAFTETACGLQTHYEDSGQASSYEVDNGNRMPSWEKKGYAPTDPVTDWNM